MLENALEPNDFCEAEEIREAVAETDAEIPDSVESQEDAVTSNSGEDDLNKSAEAGGEEITDACQIKTLTAAGSDYTVTLTYDETAGLPADATLFVSEIARNSDDYQTYLKETKKAMGLLEEETLPHYAARFFDIKIIVGEQEFTPESGVSVEIAYTEPLAEHPKTDVRAVHFADETTDAEVIEVSTSDIKEDGTDGGKTAVEFTAESFSVYGVIYTVDLYWEVDGKTYEL